MSQAAAPKNKEAHCNQCVGIRQHKVLHSEDVCWTDLIDDVHKIEGNNVYEMLQCCGCGHICMRDTSWFSEDLDDYGRPVFRERYYPPLVSRAKPEWLSSYPGSWYGSTMVGLLKEIYEALHNDSRRLAAMGVRALIEHVMIDQVGDLGSFGRNLRAFHEAGHISNSQKDRLESILEVGHAAIHRDFKPAPEDLKTLLDITENMIADIYVHTERAKKLASRIPPRTKVTKKK